jgi:hypothetical protein
MATKLRKCARDLTKKEGALTALQLSALRVLKRREPDDLREFGLHTRRSLLGRKLIDRIGRASRSVLAPERFVMTPFGRTVLAARELHEGRAKR